MTLTQAISIVARVHTRAASNDPTDFLIEIGARAEGIINGVTPAEWQTAWRVIRENAGLQPEDSQ